jgi:hypothetical protein
MLSMIGKKSGSALCVIWFCLAMGSAAADETERMLYDFAAPDADKQWRAVNDGVMGGLSEGKFSISADKTFEFFGNLSLENKGGFASVRTQAKDLGLAKGDLLVVRLRGDGRSYFFNVHVPTFRIAFSYLMPFDTKAGQWIEVVNSCRMPTHPPKRPSIH